MQKIYLFALGIMFVATVATAKNKNVLFLGNSYIYTNDMPTMIKLIAESKGDTFTSKQNTPGGHTLQGHRNNNSSVSLIYSQPWDFVVLQEQSQRPAFSPAQVAKDVMPYAKSLDSMVQDNNACSQTMFMMTWGYENGDASNCGNYPPICTYNGMQDGLRSSYLQMTIYNYANVAPIGAAWKVVRDSFPSIKLYSPDGSHPSAEGTYLGACVFYASIFHKSPVGSSYTAGLNAANVQHLQRIAARVVLDSLETWQQHSDLSYANFTYTKMGTTVTFQNKSVRSNSYVWDFGDGTTSTALSPVKTYATLGNYSVSLKAINGCNNDVNTQNVNLFATSISISTDQQSMPFVVSGAGTSYIQLPAGNVYNKLEVYDVTGKCVSAMPVHQGQQKLQLDYTKGLYIFRLSGITEVYKGKVIIE